MLMIAPFRKYPIIAQTGARFASDAVGHIFEKNVRAILSGPERLFMMIERAGIKKCWTIRLEMWDEPQMRVLKLFALLAFASIPAHAGNNAVIEAYCFTPGQDCRGLITGEIAKAKKQILVAAFSFTSSPIARALLGAHKRGVDVRVVLDKNQAGEKYSIADFLANQGVRVWIDAEHASAHNKVMIFDERLVLTGSFNFTKAAQDWNAENIVMLSSPAFTAAHIRNWQTHLKHSERYVGKGRR